MAIVSAAAWEPTTYDPRNLTLPRRRAGWRDKEFLRPLANEAVVR